MVNKKFSSFVLAFLFAASLSAFSQPQLAKDYSYVMDIPDMVTMASSPAHLYAMSESEGLAVFRTHPDTLQWLYTSTGMQQRGNIITADIRFAYLFGNSRRLTVLEPTSVLGVYSSTMLPSRPLDTKRIGQNLYIALGSDGLGRLSLETPASVDSALAIINKSDIANKNIRDLEVNGSQLFALSADQNLYTLVDKKKDGDISVEKRFDLSRPVKKIFLVENTLYGSDDGGNIYEIDGSGNLVALGSVGEPVTKIDIWKDWLIIRGSSNRIWTSYQNTRPELWKDDPEAGNYFTVTKGNLWLSEYNQISKIKAAETVNADSAGNGATKSWSGEVTLKQISQQNIPSSKPLILPIEFNEKIPANSVAITYKSPDISSAEVRGRSFYWQPSSNDTGNHRVKIIATAQSGKIDSTSFNIRVRSFNIPPRFAPIRTISIPVGEQFTLPIQATDPDGSDKDLIRFLGINLPDGASINEKTGEFSWTPTARQVGKNQFRVIATDQYGAAQSTDITIRVVDNVQRDTTGGGSGS